MAGANGLKYTKKGLNVRYVYKYRVKAYENVGGKKQYIASTPVIHVAGSKAKHTS